MLQCGPETEMTMSASISLTILSIGSIVGTMMALTLVSHGPDRQPKRPSNPVIRAFAAVSAVLIAIVAARAVNGSI